MNAQLLHCVMYKSFFELFIRLKNDIKERNFQAPLRNIYQFNSIIAPLMFNRITPIQGKENEEKLHTCFEYVRNSRTTQ